MKKLLNWIKKRWVDVNGKKTTIGMSIVLISQGMKLFFPELLQPEQYQYFETIGLFIGGAGIAHKGQKQINSAIKRTKK